MAIFKLTKETLTPLEETQFSAAGFLERKDLQRLLRNNIAVLDPDLMVIAEEFGNWVDSSRRIDLLCIDKDADLVVVELKRTEDGGYMELQAIRYAAMVSSITFVQLVDAHKNYLAIAGRPIETAETSILEFLGWDGANEDIFAQEVRILLAAADFSKELTTSVIWLNDQGLDIRCMRLKPYRADEGALLLDVQQLIPLPEAADYQTQIKAKERAGRGDRIERHDLRYRFWSALLAYARTMTSLHVHRTAGIYNWIGGSLGRQGFSLNYVVREHESQVEVYIDLGPDSDASNLQIFNLLKRRSGEIETKFGAGLDWQDLPDSRACRIRFVLQGGYRSAELDWPKIHEAMVDAMIRLDKALRQTVQGLPAVPESRPIPFAGRDADFNPL